MASRYDCDDIAYIFLIGDSGVGKSSIVDSWPGETRTGRFTILQVTYKPLWTQTGPCHLKDSDLIRLHLNKSWRL